MILTRDSIQAWLNRCHAGNRRWLAEQTGFALGSINNAFAQGTFSKPLLAAIALLMERDEGPAREGDLLRFSASEFELIDQARIIQGYETRIEFYHDAILEAANDALTQPKGDSPTHTFPFPQESFGDPEDRPLEDQAAEP